jgi:hypothetical protein
MDMPVATSNGHYILTMCCCQLEVSKLITTIGRSKLITRIGSREVSL